MRRTDISGSTAEQRNRPTLRLVASQHVAGESHLDETTSDDTGIESKKSSALWRSVIATTQNRINEWVVSCQFRLGYRAYWSGNFNRAYRWLEPLANNNDCAAQYYIGRMHSRGESVARDMGEALRWWNASAGRGERWAQIEIGNLYETGSGVPQDYTKARRWYQRAADAGLAEAQVRIGYFHDAGLGGLPVNHLLARQYYLRAAVQGEKNAYHNLAVHYAHGLGMPVDKQKALVWLNKARPHEVKFAGDAQAEIW